MSIQIDSAMIRSLPKWAQVAFAARCARRVTPLFNALRQAESPPDDISDFMEDAMQFVESAVWWADVDGEADRYLRNADSAVDDCGSPAAEPLGRATVYAAEAAIAASEGDGRESVERTMATIFTGVKGESYASDLYRAMENDFAKLTTAVEQEAWNDDTGISCGVFGKMWPDGLPADWPVDAAPILQSVSKPPFTSEYPTEYETYHAPFANPRTLDHWVEPTPSRIEEPLGEFDTSPIHMLVIEKAKSALGQIGSLHSGLDRGFDLWEEIQNTARWVNTLSKLILPSFSRHFKLSGLANDGVAQSWSGLDDSCKFAIQQIKLGQAERIVRLHQNEFDRYLVDCVKHLSDCFLAEPESEFRIQIALTLGELPKEYAEPVLRHLQSSEESDDVSKAIQVALDEFSPADTDKVFALLESREANDRLAALKQIHKMSDEDRVIAALKKRLNDDPVAEIRAKALSRLANTQSGDDLLNVLEMSSADLDRDVRFASFQAAISSPLSTDEIAPILRRGLADSDDVIRFTIHRALRDERRCSRAVDLLVESVQAGTHRSAAIESLVHLSREHGLIPVSIPNGFLELASQLSNSNEYSDQMTGQHLAYLFGEIRDTSCLPVLEKMADTGVRGIVDAVLAATSWFAGTSEYVDSMQRLLRSEHPLVRQGAARFLAYGDELSPEDRHRIEPDIARLLDDADADVRKTAAKAYENLGFQLVGSASDVVKNDSETP